MNPESRPPPATEPPAARCGDATARAAGGRRRRVPRSRSSTSSPTWSARIPAHAREHDWFVATALAVRDHDRRPLDGRDAQDLPRRPQARLLLLARIPDRPPAVRRARQSRPHRRSRARRCATSASTSTGCASSSPTPRSATAASAGSPRASWKAWRRSAIPAHGYGIRYDHGIFRQVLKDGWQHRAARGLAVVRQSVGVRAAGGRLHDRLRRHRRRRRDDEDGTPRYVWHPAETVNAVAYDTPIAGWRGRHVNTLRLWSARADRPVCARRLQPRRPRRRARRPRAPRGDLARALPERRDRRPARSCGCGRSSSSRRRRCRTCCAGTSTQHGELLVARRPRRDPAQRHASGDRDPRADAPAGRRARHAVGARVEDHDVGVQLHEPHAAAGGARDLARAAARAPAAAAHADHLPHQRAASRRASAPRAATTTRSCRRCR